MIHLLNGLHKTTLSFVDKTNEHGDIWSFRFTPDRPVPHIAGQHAAFIIKGAGFHVFSIASAPREGLIQIGTHVREGSKYKAALAALAPGQTITMYGPVLNFTLEKAPNSVVFLAQGIGITPYRSMLIANAHAEKPVRITLVHSDGPTPTYADETRTLATTAHYPASPEEFASIVKTVTGVEPAAKYYLSGSPGFIKATKATLKAAGIGRARMKTDTYWGY